MGVIFDWTSLLARFCPNAALIRSTGKPLVKTLPIFWVPVSSLFRADTSWALSQPTVHVSKGVMGGPPKLKNSHTRIDHHVHRALREDGSFVGRENLGDEACAIFLIHVGGRVTVDRNYVIRRARVVVHRQHGAGSEVQHGHYKAHG